MAFESAIGYVLVLLLWLISIKRDGGLGVGVRFMYGVNLFMFFLLGPLLGAIFDQTENFRFTINPIGPAINIALLAMLFYIVAAYWLAPVVFLRRSVIPHVWFDAMQSPDRLKTEEFVAWFLIFTGTIISPFAKFLLFIPTIGAVLSQAGFLVDTGMLMLLIQSRFSGKTKGLILASALYIFKYFVFAAVSGHAGWLFINGIIIISIWQFAIKFQVSRIPGVVAIGLLMFIPVTIWLQGRQVLRTAIEDQASLSTTLWMTLDVFMKPPEESISLIEMYRNRGDYSDLMAATLTHTPIFEPFAMGETYWLTIISVVPRAVWPDKPLIMGGSKTVTRFSGIQFGATTSVAMNYMFEMYVNFGYTGVVLGMTLLGLFLAKMESLCYTIGIRNILFEVLTIHLGWVICIFSDKIYEAVGTSLSAIVLILIVYHIAIWAMKRSKFARHIRSLLGVNGSSGS